MISKEMVALGTQRSVIREISMYGAKRKTETDPENVLDFSLGNPNVPSPDEITAAILDIVNTKSPIEYNGYTASAGAEGTRAAIANNLNRRFGTKYDVNHLYLTCGAAASLAISLKAIVTSDEDEIIVFTPYFPEYKVYIEGRGAKMIQVESANDFQISFEELEKSINPNTKAVLINSPNNPSGVVYGKETIRRLAELLKRKSEEYDHTIFILSDEPYRELVYGGVEVPFIPNYYDSAIVCYSWSKSLSLPGERIGYILAPNKGPHQADLVSAIAGAGRSLGYVCAPSLFQQVIERCVDVMPDLTTYEINRSLLIESLERFGYEFAKPDGAFYLFIRSPFEGGGQAFHERAKEYDMLVVPGASFGCAEYVRLSYCCTTESAKKAIPILEELIRQTRDRSGEKEGIFNEIV